MDKVIYTPPELTVSSGPREGQKVGGKPLVLTLVNNDGNYAVYRDETGEVYKFKSAYAAKLPRPGVAETKPVPVSEDTPAASGPSAEAPKKPRSVKKPVSEDTPAAS